MRGPAPNLVFGDWRSGVEHTYRSVRRTAFALGAIGAVVAAIGWDWPAGWVIVGVLTLGLVHALRLPRFAGPITQEVAADAAIIGICVWVLGVQGLGFLLVYPLAIALLLGDRRLVWVVAGTSFATNTLLYLDDTFPGSPLADSISNAFPTPQWDPAQAQVLSYGALYGIGVAMLYYLWQISRHIRSLEEEQAVLLRTAAHDLRNAVAAVAGLTEALDTSTKDGGDDRDVLAAIADTVSEATAICSDLLSLARRSPGGPAGSAEFNLGSLVRGIVTPYERVTLHTPPRVPVVGDQQRVGQIVRNLVANAVRHGGPHVVVSVVPVGGRVLVRVADDGAGVEGDPTEVFAPKPSTHVDGMGIGLATAHDLAVRIGGELTYRREAGWSEFTLSLVGHAEAPAPAPAAQPVRAR